MHVALLFSHQLPSCLLVLSLCFCSFNFFFIVLFQEQNKITNDGYLIVTSDKTRKQILNQADCIDKIRQMVFVAGRPPKQPSPEKIQEIERRLVWWLWSADFVRLKIVFAKQKLVLTFPPPPTSSEKKLSVSLDFFAFRKAAIKRSVLREKRMHSLKKAQRRPENWE